MNVLTCPLTVFRRILAVLPAGPVRCPLATGRTGGDREFLVAPPGPAADPHLLVVRFDAPERPPGAAAVLALGAGRQRGHARAYLADADWPALIHQLNLVGPGMHAVPLAPAPERRIGQGDPSRTERWSRTVAALGPDGWDRLSRLHYAIVGVGRSGSIVADAVACGWGGRLTLIDPDLLEPHNLGEMVAVGAADLGKPKAEAVADGLRRRGPAGSSVEAVVHSATHLPALHALRRSDVIIGCVDHDGARLALAALAVLFCKPYLDLATGIHGIGTARRMGADVRLAVPGERCLWCLGGLSDPAGAQRVLASADAEKYFGRSRDWRQERTGSLRSLNHLAAALALRLWEDFVTERLTGSTWLRGEVDPTGRLMIGYPAASAAGCPLCPLLGQGEEGLRRAQAFFQDGSTV